MNPETFIRLIFAGRRIPSWAKPAGKGAVLFPDGGEYCTALRRLLSLGEEGPAGFPVPDEVYLHLFACELLERMREQAAAPPGLKATLLVFPFWPSCLFQAAGSPVHGAEEIQRLFPPAGETWYVRQPLEEIALEGWRVLAGLRFDPRRYQKVLEETAEKEGWTLRSHGT